jgi:hypothetical protein
MSFLNVDLGMQQPLSTVLIMVKDNYTPHWSWIHQQNTHNFSGALKCFLTLILLITSGWHA